jgi:hypothetical protein
MSTRDLHSIDCSVGLESIMLRHHCTLLALCYALHITEILVQRQWRYVHTTLFLRHHCSYPLQGVKAAKVHATGKRRTRHTASSSIQVIDEEEDSQTDTRHQLPTPRETPQPEMESQTPAIADTLFDFVDISPDFCMHHTRTGTAGNPLMTVIDSQGVFEMEVLFCACSDRNSRDQQLLKAGLFPATFKQIETLFTFAVLDNFLADNLECKTTVQQYYSKLQSMTSNMFPDHIPVR